MGKMGAFAELDVKRLMGVKTHVLTPCWLVV
jgi:hypothetical protein